MYKSSCAAKMRRRLKEKPSVPSFSSPSSDVNLIPDLHAPSIGLAMPLNVDTSFPSEIYQVQTTNSLRDDLKAITELAEASCNNRNAFQDMNQFFSHECNSAVSSIGQSLEQKMQAMLQSCNGQQSQEILKTQPQNLSLSSILAGGNPSVTPPEVPSSQLIDHNRSTALPRRGSLQWEKLLMLAGRKINYDDDPFEPIPL